jgi:hypothetical protein
MKVVTQAESVNVHVLSSKDTKFSEVRIGIPVATMGQ